MALNFEEESNIFPHGRKTDTGSGEERVGQATIVVSLDGSGDTDNLTDAIKMLPTGGGIIAVKEGQFDSGEITVTKDNVTIQGTGKGTIINSSANNGIAATSRNGLLIKNLQLIAVDAGVKFTACTESTITECWFTGGTNRGILVVGSGGTLNEGILISNSHFTNEGNGMLLSDVKETVAIGNKMVVTHTNANRGIGIIGEDGTSEDNIVANNIIDGYDNQGIQLDVTTATQKNILIGNRIKNSTTGIDIIANVDRTLITGNIIVDCTTKIADAGTNTMAATNIIV